jgi:hypothetical protein
MIARVLRAEKEPTEPAYPDLVLISARNYASALKEGRHRFSDVGRAACDRLVATIEAAIERRIELRRSDIAFDARSLDGITAEDRVQFVNQFVLGTGWDGAPILVMGTEAAEDYKASDAEELAFHCLYVVLQLSGGSIEILRAMAVGSTWGAKVKEWALPRRRYDFEPNDLLQLNMGRPRTWRILAEVAAGSTDRVVWNTMFDNPERGVGLGAVTYQIERSAHSALQATLGMPPTPSRLNFLADEVIPRLRLSASTLLLHGFGGSRSKEWWPADERLIQAFVNSPASIPLTWEHKVGGQSIEFLEADGRRVIYSRALNGAIPRAYKDLVISLVHDPTPPWPPGRSSPSRSE